MTGMSGTGKSTALAELGRRGFEVVDTDSTDWSEWIPAAGSGKGEWLWREDPDRPAPDAGARTHAVRVRVHVEPGEVLRRFDAVVLLSAPVEVILDRVENRTTNDYGKGPGERDLILFHLTSVEPMLRATCTHEIDVSGPLDDVVDALIAIGQNIAS